MHPACTTFTKGVRSNPSVFAAFLAASTVAALGTGCLVKIHSPEPLMSRNVCGPSRPVRHAPLEGVVGGPPEMTDQASGAVESPEEATIQ